MYADIKSRKILRLAEKEVREFTDIFDSTNLNIRNKHKAFKKWLNRRAKIGKIEMRKLFMRIALPPIRFETHADLWDRDYGENEDDERKDN